MNKHELQHKISLAIQEQRTILNKAKGEKRNYTSDEQKRHDELQTEIDNHKRELSILEQEEEHLRTDLGDRSNNQDNKNEKKKSFSKAFNEFRTALKNGAGTVTMNMKALKDETRTGELQVGTDPQAVGVEVKQVDFFGAVRTQSVARQMGAKMKTGLTADGIIPIINATTAKFVDETGEGEKSGGLGAVKMTAHRITAEVVISKRLAIQHPANILDIFREDLPLAVAYAIDQAYFSGAGDAVEPKGILLYDEVKTVTGASDVPTFKEIKKLEYTSRKTGARGQNMGYGVSADVAEVLEATPKDPSSNAKMIMEDDKIGKYNAMTDFTIMGKELIFGQWDATIIGLWDDLEVTVDPYTKASNGQLKLVINAFADIKTARPELFTKFVAPVVASAKKS